MLSQERQSTRSPTSSTRTESVRTGPTTGLSGRMSHQTSITEEDDDRHSIPPAPPLPSTIRASTKASSASSTSSSSSPTASMTKPSTGGKNTTTTANMLNTQRSTLRHISPTEQNNYNRQTTNQTTTPSETKRTTPRTLDRVSARNFENEKPSTTFSPLTRGGKENQSIFEKVDRHSGRASYLGTGSYPQLEDCIRNCLGRNQSHTNISNYTRSSPLKNLTRASVLEDYSYDGIISKNHTHRSSSHHHFDHPHSEHHHYDHHHSDHHHSGHHTKSAAELSLTEIREVNDNLARYGISVFSPHHHPHHPQHPHNQPHPVGDVISACRLLIEDPAFRSRMEGSHATQDPHAHGYASPAVRSVASHLFNSGQTQYDPVHSVASHLFSNPQQSPYNHPYQPQYNPPYQPPYNPPYQSSYNPPYQPSYNPSQQAPQSSSTSVLSRLFGSS